MLFVHMKPVFFRPLVLASATISGLKANYGAIFEAEDCVVGPPGGNFMLGNEWSMGLAWRNEAIIKVFRLNYVAGGRKVECRYPARRSSITNLH
jgi:hypothetical protein